MKIITRFSNYVYKNLSSIESLIFGFFAVIFGFWTISILPVFGNKAPLLLLACGLLGAWFVFSEIIKMSPSFAKQGFRNRMLVWDTIIFGILFNAVIIIFHIYGAHYSNVDYLFLLPAISIPLYYNVFPGFLSLITIYGMFFSIAIIYPVINNNYSFTILQFLLYLTAYLLLGIINKKKDDETLSCTLANVELTNLDKDKDRFIATAAHELRRPITVTQGYLEMLYDDEMPPKEQREAVSKAYFASQSMGHLASRLLSLNQIQLGKLQISSDYFNPKELCQRIIEGFKILSENKNIKFYFDNKSSVTNLFGDSGLIEEVLTNLLNNSLKFTKKGKIGIEITENSNETIFGVSDTGVGISKEEQGKVFGKFYQGVANKTSLNGLGIGLFLSKEIISAHKGKIWVTSTLGVGTTIFFSIPK